MQNAGNHPEQVQLLCVVQTDLLHGHTHPIEVTQVIKKGVLQRTDVQMLQNTWVSQKKLRSQEKQTLSENSIQIMIYSNKMQFPNDNLFYILAVS